MAYPKKKPVGEEAARVKNAPTIGYWSCLGGVEVKFIEDDDDLNPTVTGLIGTFAGKPDVFQRRIQAEMKKDGREFITICGTHLYLDECIRNPL